MSVTQHTDTPRKPLPTAPPRYNGKHPGGRPTKYSDTLAKDILDMYASTTLPVDDICAAVGIHKQTLYRWQQEYPKFCDAMTRARRTRAIAEFDETSQRIEALRNDVAGVTEDTARTAHVKIQAERITLEAAKFRIQKGNPQLFADKRQEEVVHKIEIPLLEQAFEAHRQQLQDATANSQGDDTASSQAIDANYDVLDHDEHDVQETDTQQDTHGT